MKRLVIIAMLALSLSAVAQNRPHGNNRNVNQTSGRYVYSADRNNTSYNNSFYFYSDRFYKDIHRLDLSLYQERELKNMIAVMHNDIQFAQRKYRNPQNTILRIERDFDRKLVKLLNAKQYKKWNQYYAYQYVSKGYGRV